MMSKINQLNKKFSLISLTLLWLCSTCQCLPQLQGSAATRNNNLRGQEGRRNNNRDSITTNRPPNRGQRILEGGFVPSNFGNELRNVRFPDGTNRPVGRRGPQQSPFRNSNQNSDNTAQNARRTNGGARAQNDRRPNPTRNRPEPQPTRNRSQSPPIRNRPESQRNPRVLLPAIPITFKYTRPRFDVLGNPLVFKEVAPEEGDFLPDFRDPQGKRNRGNTKKTTRKPRPSNLGPDLRPKLPIFGQPDLILKATEELRNSDINQNAIISLGKVNAGVLPLATEDEDDQQLGFFPPFNIRKIQPK